MGAGAGRGGQAHRERGRLEQPGLGVGLALAHWKRVPKGPRQVRQAVVDHLLLSSKPWALGALAGGLGSLFDRPPLEALLLPEARPPQEAAEAAWRWFQQGLQRPGHGVRELRQACWATGYRWPR